jgi:hypothetical protein
LINRNRPFNSSIERNELAWLFQAEGEDVLPRNVRHIILVLRFVMPLGGLAHGDETFSTACISMVEEVDDAVKTQHATDCDCDYWREDGGCARWTATAEALFVHRTTAGSNPLFLENATGDTALDASDLSFDYEAGVRLGLTRQRPCRWGLEVNYLSIDNWNSTVAVDSLGFAFTENFSGFSYSDIERFTAQYDAKFYSGEVNVRRQITDNVTGLAGYRMFELDEDLMISGTAPFGFFTDILHTDTVNHLYGGQVGVDAHLFSLERARISSVAKAGVYYNWAAQTSTDVNGSLVDPGFSLSDSRGTAAFLGELGIQGVYQVTNCLALRAGYNLLYVSQVALAPHQTNNTDLATGVVSVDTGGHLFAHGVVAGVELVR